MLDPGMEQSMGESITQTHPGREDRGNSVRGKKGTKPSKAGGPSLLGERRKSKSTTPLDTKEKKRPGKKREGRRGRPRPSTKELSTKKRGEIQLVPNRNNSAHNTFGLGEKKTRTTSRPGVCREEIVQSRSLLRLTPRKTGKGGGAGDSQHRTFQTLRCQQVSKNGEEGTGPTESWARTERGPKRKKNNPTSLQ